MSDHWIAVIPRMPEYVPSPAQAESALSFLKAAAPESERVTFAMDDCIKFRDCGENLEFISCPHCSAALEEDWWSDRMSEDYDDGGGFSAASVLSLDQLCYIFDQGFSKFILEAMNPNIGKLELEQVEQLSNLLGTELRVIYQHI